MAESAVERYLRLGLQLGRHVEGLVDAYYGPPDLAAAVEAEPPVAPPALVSAAEALLDDLEDGWLRDQVLGVCTYAGVLAGESRSYADEAVARHGGNRQPCTRRTARGAPAERRSPQSSTTSVSRSISPTLSPSGGPSSRADGRRSTPR